MARSGLRWFRVELDAKGAVASCREVDQAGAEERVLYLRAVTAAEAARQAVNAHAARLLAARRAKYRAEGRCKCGRMREDQNFVTCSRCRQLSHVHSERSDMRAEGIEPPPRDRRVVLQQRKAEERDAAVEAAVPSLRLSVLLEVQAAWQRASTNGAFTRWLEQQVGAAKAGKAA